jgi:hypothetical protein
VKRSTPRWPLPIAAALLVVACQPTATPTGRPSVPAGPPVLGADWGRAASLDRPENYMESVPPDYISNHPILRIAGQATMSDVVSGSGRIVSVGYAPPDWLPIAWTSPDGQHWAIHAMGSSVNTFPVAVAAGAGGGFVAVGRSGKLPVAWTSPDGESWTQQTVPVLGTDGTAERMTSIAAFAGGFVAGGSVGPELGDRYARFWRSSDGAAWAPVPDDGQAFPNVEVRSITNAPGGGFVAVGLVGAAEHPTGSVAWVSNDGSRWSRIDDASLVGGVAASVVAAPFGGLVAVGSTLDRQEALVWTSVDGRIWARVDGGRDFQEPGFVWMTDAVAVGDEVIAVGDYQPNQRGTAVSWISRDGVTWKRAAPAPVQEQAEFAAIAAGGPGAVAVGVYGLPDSFVPTVWLTPAR